METYSLQKINEVFCSFLEKRLSKMGELSGGLYNYYVQRLKTREILSKEDKEIIKYAQKRFPIDSKILEVGGGIGQLGHTLSVLGYLNITICEVDKRRREACIALGELLQSSAIVLEEEFPECYHQSYDLVVIANVVGSFNNLKKDIPFFKGILIHTKILFFPSLYDDDVDRKAIFLFKEFGIKYQMIGEGLMLLERVL